MKLLLAGNFGGDEHDGFVAGDVADFEADGAGGEANGAVLEIGGFGTLADDEALLIDLISVSLG